MENHAAKPGDSNKLTREYIDSLLIEMRHIGASLPSTQLMLYGWTFDTPIMTAALSHLKNDGLVKQAEAAKALNAVNWLGMGPEEELERVIATGAKTIKIIKPYKDDARIFKKIEHAERFGALAVGVDLDHSFSGDGTYDVVLGDEMRAKTLDDIKAYVRATKLPFIIKGVLSVRDALQCAEAGVQGIVVSHHHGIMNYAVPTLRVLPAIAKALNGSMPIFVDCGIESGYDVFKCLALGATAASIGRALMPPIEKDGAAGAQTVLTDATRQLRGVMARTACKTLSEIDESLIWPTKR
jgi:L-lactate dehydrogenase (FMN-dependent) and related alpha-hydroxy acid dehydrogenases